MSNQIVPSTVTGPEDVHVLLVCREGRRSKGDSETADNLETQEAKLRDWAKQNIPGLKGIEVLNLVEASRPRGAIREQLLQAMRSTESMLLLTCSINRLVRTAFLAPVLAAAQKRGIRILGIEDSFDSNNTTLRTILEFLTFDNFVVNQARRRSAGRAKK